MILREGELEQDQFPPLKDDALMRTIRGVWAF